MTHVSPRPWDGRDDGDAPEDRRWHQHVICADDDAARGLPSASVALAGFASHTGVLRNEGREGAAEGPRALRRALSSLAVHRTPPLVDFGDVTIDGYPDAGEPLEAGMVEFGQVVAGAMERHGLVVALGGGHEMAYATYLGRTAAERLAGKRVGVVNLDAHFDLRDEPMPSSGTSFLRMAQDDAAAGREFRYFVAGISEASNTRRLFGTAEELGTEYVLDRDCQLRHLDALLERLDRFVADVDAVHLSVDLDVLPASIAPGVSAPAGYGVPMEVVEEVCRHLAGSGKLVLTDVVELAPRHDVDGCTARAAARLIHTVVENWQGQG